ncbi:hypothetical protein DRQ33_03620 [bacterium]|nr:MAG: hypothetical protein DRQ33_03620 [bacterium]
MLENLIGTRILITISNPEMQDRELRPRVEILQGESITIAARVVETDELGIWIEHSDYPFPDPVTNKFSKQKSYILIRYEFITSIAFFPELPTATAEEEHRIGFVEDYRE